MKSVSSTFRLSCGSRVLDLSTPQVMGILNVTPDSFSDGGRYNQLDRASYHAEQMGAGLINDVRALQRPGALDAAVQVGLPVCLMHMQGTPQDMQTEPAYHDVLQEVGTFLVTRRAECVAAGIPATHILFDPGFGFGKNLVHNLQLFQFLERLHELEQPLLVGVSRKSMIGQVLGRDSGERLVGSLALAALAVTKGVHILRVHDVPETVDVVRMITAVQSA